MNKLFTYTSTVLFASFGCIVLFCPGQAACWVWLDQATDGIMGLCGAVTGCP